jgi:hypothetical protein
MLLKKSKPSKHSENSSTWDSKRPRPGRQDALYAQEKYEKRRG